jgi:hypothetical protein
MPEPHAVPPAPPRYDLLQSSPSRRERDIAYWQSRGYANGRGPFWHRYWFVPKGALGTLALLICLNDWPGKVFGVTVGLIVVYLVLRVRREDREVARFLAVGPEPKPDPKGYAELQAAMAQLRAAEARRP